MKQFLILVTLNIIGTLCFSQEYAQVFKKEVSYTQQQGTINNHASILKNESTIGRVEDVFLSEENYTNQRLENIACNSSSNLSLIDVLSANEFIDIDDEMFTINMKDKDEIVLFINDVKMNVTNFQMYQLLKKMKANKVKSVEIINVPDYKSSYTRNSGIIKIKNY